MHTFSHTQQPGRFRLREDRAAAMLMALFIVVLLSLLLAGVMQTVSNKYTVTMQTAGWQEALHAAEAGADIAIAELRKLPNDSTSAWITTFPNATGGTDVWKVDTGGNGAFTANATGGNINTYPKRLTTTLAGHAGEGANTAMRITVTVDKPATLVDASGRQWLRVRSTGGVDLSGPPRVSSEKLDNMLHKLSLKWDKATNTAVTTPRVSRTIECIAKPTTMFGSALMAEVQYKNDGAGIIADSYDSSDPTTLTNGAYDPAKRKKNGDVNSNGFPIKHDHSFDMNFKADYVFGDVGNNYSNIRGVDPSYFNGLNGHPATNTDKLIKTDGNAQITGDIDTSYYRDLPRIPVPTWTTVTANLGKIDNAEPDYTVSTNPNNPSRFVADSVDLNHSNTWLLKLPAGATDGYVEVWVKGDINLHDGGQIAIAPGVHAKLYFARNLTLDDSNVKNAGFDVQSDFPGDLLLLGIEQPDNTKKQADAYAGTVYTPLKATGNVVLKSADLSAALYAPDHNLVIDMNGVAKRLHLNGKASKRLQYGVDVYGSFVARTINMKGPTNIHYDEALADVGPANDWGYVTWYEVLNLDAR